MRIAEVPHRITEDQWNRYRPEAVAGYSIGELVRAWPDRAIFRTTAPSGSTSRYIWLFESGEASPDFRVNRFLEATFFDHPNLLRVYTVGVSEDSEPLIYVITEPFERTLTEPEAPYSSRSEGFKQVLFGVCAGLSWLHSQNLVCCALRDDFVVHAGGEWKLADFSELRVAGRTAPEETRRLLIRRDLYVPPEAYEGIVSPAWDAWSLGVLVQNLWAREARATGRNPRVLPPELAELVRELADTDPAQRLGVDAFAERLTHTSVEPVSEIAAPGDLTSQAPIQPEVEPTVAETPSLGVAGSQFAEPPPGRAARSSQYRVAAAVALAFGAVLILATLYGHPAGANHQSTPNPTPAASDTRSAPPPAIENSAAAPEEKPDPFDTASARGEGNTGDEKREIEALLDRWVESTRNRDAARQASCYAPVVQQFFGRRNVTAENVRRAKARAFAEVGPTREFSISDVRFERVNPDRAVVSFLKTWDFPARHFAGSTREEMVIERVGGAWKISSERELNQSAAQAPGSKSALPGPATGDPDSILTGETERNTRGTPGNQ